jgi:hypothetical protein
VLLLLPVFLVPAGLGGDVTDAHRVVAILFSGAGLIMGAAAFVVLLRWKPDGSQAIQVPAAEHNAALVAMSASLAGLLLFCVALDGIARAISYSYVFDEYWTVPWLMAFTNILVLWLSWRVLIGKRPTLGRILVPILLAAMALAGPLHLFIMTHSDALSFPFVAPRLLVAAAQAAAAGVIAFARPWLAAAPAGRDAAAQPDRLPP